jgi:hypothetical protein
MARHRRRNIEAFSLSLLDLLCCAFGGVIVLSVVFSASMRPAAGANEKTSLAIALELPIPPGKPWPLRDAGFQLGVLVTNSTGGTIADAHKGSFTATPPAKATTFVLSDKHCDCAQLFLSIEGLDPGEVHVYATVADMVWNTAPYIEPIRRLPPLHVTLWAGGQAARTVEGPGWEPVVEQLNKGRLPGETGSIEIFKIPVCVPAPDGSGCPERTP